MKNIDDDVIIVELIIYTVETHSTKYNIYVICTNTYSNRTLYIYTHTHIHIYIYTYKHTYI